MYEMEQVETNNKKGGYRPGAGRKKKDGVGTEQISVRINVEHLQIIREHHPKSVSDFISKAVKDKLKRGGLIWLPLFLCTFASRY